MEILSNREISTAIWLLIFFVWVFAKKEVRSSFSAVLDAFFNRKILIPIGLLILHTLLIVWFLKQVGMWESNQTKNTILWFICVAFVSLFRLPKIADDRNYFKNAITDNLKIIVVLEFLVTFYTFSLIIELIFVPFMAILGALLAYSQTDEKYALVEKLINRLAIIIGIAIIVYTIDRLLTNFDEFAQIQTFYDFSLPIILSILLLPLIYIFHVYMTYEGVFIGMEFSIKDEELRKYAKRTSVIKYHLNIHTLKRWADALNRKTISCTSDIDELHKDISRLEKEEKDPPEVSFSLGWSPYKIASALEHMGLTAGYYKNLDGDEWFASSPNIEVGNGILTNNIAYYLEGNQYLLGSESPYIEIIEEKYSVTVSNNRRCILKK